MQYGLLGQRLSHSFSKDIHDSLGAYSYDLIKLSPHELSSFIRGRDFSGLNVTIPYKEAVIPYLDVLDHFAEEIGAVNTIVNDGGRLIGYNTDHYGMIKLIERAKITLAGKKVVILGTGGTSKTAFAVARHLGAKEILRVSRSGRDGAVTYDELYSLHGDAEIIINTTPCGMYPLCDESPLELERLPSVSGVIDAVYNPLRTPLVLDARERKIRAEGGLYMLVMQAIRASELFLNTVYDERIAQRIMRRITREKENIVLIGMPASGKSRIGRLLEKTTLRPLIDTDKVIEERLGKTVSEVFSDFGEAYFREVEADVIREASKKTGIIIATGGGSVLRYDSVKNLRRNGRLYFIDRPLSSLTPTASRPLASNTADIEKRYNERYGIYTAVCDVRIDASSSAPMTADKILNEHNLQVKI